MVPDNSSPNFLGWQTMTQAIKIDRVYLVRGLIGWIFIGLYYPFEQVLPLYALY